MRRRTFLVGSLGSARLAAGQQVRSLGTLAYVQADGLWVRDLPDGRTRRLAAGTRLASPRFSPSGRWVLFTNEEVLHVVSREGGPAVRFEGQRGQWWPNRDDLLVEQTAGLGVFSATTGWRALPWSIPGGNLPAIFSPDATEIAYADEAKIAGVRTGRLLCVGAARPGGPPRAVVTEPGNAVIPCRWMPDGPELLYWLDPDFSVSVASDGLELFRIPARSPGAKPRSLGASTLVHGDFLSLAPRGGALAVAAGDDRGACRNKRIARIEWPGGEVRYLTDERTAAVTPAWSPDGERIAYSAAPALPDGCGGGELMRHSLARRRIWIIRGAGNFRPTAVTHDERYRDEEPRWSSNGRYILFCRIDEGRNRTVWLMRSDGSGAAQVAGPLAAQDPANLGMNWFGYYGTVRWKGLIDWRQSVLS
ncbi:MAG TPA: hypothetical protein VKB79_18000 [Bryobacteraceae bacterium]|nr:hypothetical protein [Bryobacteraceae bacterium]